MADAGYKLTEDPGSPSKRLKITSVKKNIRSDDFGCELLFIELVQGGYELIILQETIGQDGYLQIVREDLKNSGPLSTKLGFVKVMSRCISKTNDNILLNTRASTKGDRYPRCCIVRMITTSTHLTRKACLDEFASFLNTSCPVPNRNNRYAHELHMKRKTADVPKYVVPSNFDITPPMKDLRKMGHAMVSKSVVEFINTAHSNINRTWATENVKLAKEFFDFPYPALAQTELGYPDHELSEKE